MKKTGMASAATMIALNGFKIEVLANVSGMVIPPKPKVAAKQRKLQAGNSGTPEQLWAMGTDEKIIIIDGPLMNQLSVAGPFTFDPDTGIFTMTGAGTITEQ
jgi:hypothetical protein